MTDAELPISDLVAYALYEADERAAQFEEPLTNFLVALALFQIPEGLAAKPLLEAVCALLPTPELHQQAIDRAIDEGVAAKVLDLAPGDRVTLSAARRGELEAAAERLQSHRAEFQNAIATSVETQLGDALGQDPREALVGGFERYLQGVFQAHSISLARAFGSDGNGLDEATEPVREQTLATFVNSVVPSTEKLRRAQYQIGIRNALLALDPGSKKHVASMYQKTVAFALLRQDPGVRRVKRALAKDRVLYLDTNVIMAWMFVSHPRHVLARNVSEIARSIGCTVRVSRFTIEELTHQLHSADRTFNDLQHRGEALGFLDNDVIRAYQHATRETVALSWAGFIGHVLPVEPWLADHGVICDKDQDWANAIHDERYDSVHRAVAAAKKAAAAPQVVEFDTRNLLYVQLRRVRWRADPMGSRVWFVTLDRSLRRAETELVKKGTYRVPASYEAPSWCEFFAAYAVPDSSEVDDYASYLVTSQLGLLGEDPKFVDTNFFMTLEESGLDLDELLGAGPERAEQVLSRLQEDHEVKRLLKSNDSQKDAPAWGKELEAAIQRALQDVGPTRAELDALEEARQQRDAARQAAGEARRERDAALRRLAELDRTQGALEERVQALESAQKRGLWRRFVDALRGREA